MKKVIIVLLSLLLMFSISLEAFATDKIEICGDTVSEAAVIPKEDEINAFSKGSRDLPQDFIDEYGNYLGKGIVRYTWKYDKEGDIAELTGKALYSYPASSNYRISATYSNVTSTSFIVRISFVDTTSVLPSQYYEYQVIVYSNGGTSQTLLS